MRAIVWKDETLGAAYDVLEIPADQVGKAKHAREQMIESLGEVDDAIMEKYVHGEAIYGGRVARCHSPRHDCHEGVPGGLRLGVQE